MSVQVLTKIELHGEWVSSCFPSNISPLPGVSVGAIVNQISFWANSEQRAIPPHTPFIILSTPKAGVCWPTCRLPTVKLQSTSHRCSAARSPSASAFPPPLGPTHAVLLFAESL